MPVESSTPRDVRVSATVNGSTSYVQANGAQEAIASGNTTSYPLTDALGSVRGVTDSTGTLTGSTDYDAFGAVRFQTGIVTRAGLHRAADRSQHRVHRSAGTAAGSDVGSFPVSRHGTTQRAGTQGYNLYAYVANNPTTWTDSSGEFAQSIVGYRVLASPPETATAMGVALAVEMQAKDPMPVSVGTLLLAYAAGYIICYLDINGPCWDQQIAGNGWVTAHVHLG